MNQQKNILWINGMKAISLIAVLFVHSQLYYGYFMDEVNPSVYPWYVNAFFFVSGYLLFWKQLSSPKIDENRNQYMASGGGRLLFQNIVYRIVIPSIIFSAIEYLPSCIIQGRGIDVSHALLKTIGGGTYWFTSALVVAELILLFLLCTRKKNIWFYAGGSFVLGIAGLTIVKLGILQSGIWAWRQGLIALVFLGFGGLYWRYEKLIDKLMRWWFALLLLFAYVVMVVGFEGYNDPLVSTLTIQPLGFLTSAIACILLVWLCKQLPEISLLSFIGKNSIGFYFMSGALPITFSVVAHKLIPDKSVWMMLLIWVTCLIVAYATVLIINRWLPWIWDLRLLNTQKQSR